MLFCFLVLATVMAAVWFLFLGMAEKEDWIAAAYNKVLDNLTMKEKLRAKHGKRLKKLSEYRGFSALFLKIPPLRGFEKKIAVLEAKNKLLQKGNLRNLGIMDIPGYVFVRKFEIIGKGTMHKTIFSNSFELYGKKHAGHKTLQLLARIFSYWAIGMAFSLIIGSIAMGFGKMEAGMGISAVGTALAFVSSYAVYDDLCDRVKKRREDIIRQFPNIASKLALLVASGMIMEKAWKETAYSQNFELYKEMQKTSEQLDNLVSPEEAYGEFIRRCNTKETAKLASAITQNLSKGNAELSFLLKTIAKEAWLERRHNAKRDAEKASSKLMIPTILLFLAILVIIMVPVVMNLTFL
ncbi:MAG: type II secretion system F family protein [Oscillospiraceae bacterium]|nr:type II secretion system F family protein [Oscillospiraceae bacterium]